MATCYHTKKYDLFKFENNRDIYLNHVDAIAANKDFVNSFEYHPAVVNKDFVVIDGQHRILAAKKLNIPAWYVIQSDANENHIMSCNINQKAWSFHDYLEHNCKKNINPTYSFIKELCESHKLPLHTIIRICQFFGNSSARAEFNKTFKNGTITFKNIEKIKGFIALYDGLIKKMTKEKSFASVKYLVNRCYCAALMTLYKTNSPKLEVILRKLPDFWMRMVSVNNQEQAIAVLESIRLAKNKS